MEGKILMFMCSGCFSYTSHLFCLLCDNNNFYFSIGNLEEAAKLFTEAILKHPTTASMYAKRARCSIKSVLCVFWTFNFSISLHFTL